jgi:hypothetical protein
VHVPLPTALLQASSLHGYLMRRGHSTTAWLLTGREGVASVCSKPW